MDCKDEMYREPEKCLVRETYLASTVASLTIDRSTSFILDPDEVLATYKHAVEVLVKYQMLPADMLEDTATLVPFENWLIPHRARTSVASSALKVLLLGGPMPSNDILVLVKHGVFPQNIWTVESNDKCYKQAIQDLKQLEFNVKIYNGELAEFLQRNNETFDLVYIDACGPFCGGRPNTLRPIFELIDKNRLSSLAVLITNFAEVKDRRDDFAGILSSYFMGRYTDYPRKSWDLGIDPADLCYDGEQLKRIISSNFDMFYSDFITRFIADIARFLIPTCSALSFKYVQEKLLDQSVINSVLKEYAYKESFDNLKEPEDWEHFTEKVFDWDLSPYSYSLYTFLKNLGKLCSSKSLADSIAGYLINGRRLGDLLPVVSSMNAMLEGHWKIVKMDFLKHVLGIWFDERGGVFCDVPLPNLLVNTHLGVFRHPHQLNTRKSQRLSYRAKDTRMFMDSFLLDNCAEYFDWFPTLDLTESFFRDIRNQLLARAMIDRMGRHDWSSSSHPFRGSALISFGASYLAKAFEIPDRVYIN